MSLVPSLLQAIVQVDGEALVMHAGDTPYVVAPGGQVDLASRGLTLDAVNGIVSQLLPPEVLQALDEFGAAQYQLPPRPDFPQEQFTVVAARGGDDLWAEIRRRRIPDEDLIPEELFGPAATAGTSHHAAAMEQAIVQSRAAETQAEIPEDDTSQDDIPEEVFGPAATAGTSHHAAALVQARAAQTHDDEVSLEDELDADSDAVESDTYEMTAMSDISVTAEFDVADPHEPALDDQALQMPDVASLWGGGDTVEPVTRVIDEPQQEEEYHELTPEEPVASEPAQHRPPTPAYEEQTAPVHAVVPPVHEEPPPAPVHVFVPPTPVREEPPPAPVHVFVPPTPVREEPPRAPVHVFVPPTPVHEEPPPAPVHVFVPATPVHEEPAPAPVRAVVQPTPMREEPTPSPVHAVVPPAPVREEPPPAAAHAVVPSVRVPEMPAAAKVRDVAPPAPVRETPPPAVQAPPHQVREVQTSPRVEQPAARHETPRLASPPVREPAAASIETRQPVPPSSPHLVQPEAQQPAVVLPMTRNPIRPEAPSAVSGQSGSGLDRLLRLAAARGASTLYLATDARPSVRVDGENQALDGEPTLTSYDVESLLLTLMPERSHEALRTGAATEWICDIEEVGRVRCMSFRDHRGPGGVFRLMAGRAVSMDQLALSPEIQSLAIEPEGLVLIVGPRSSGKRTLISAFIDLINRTRRDHVISIESEINVVHDRGTSFISQREVRGSHDDVLDAARGALREDPDVLVIEELRTGLLMNVALEAAASGHLVIGGFSAHSATGAIDRIIDLYAPEYRRQIQMALAQQVRGVVAQVLLRKNGGGRLAARELLLNTPAVASVIAEGKTSQLPMAIEGGRRRGMVPLNDALVGFVQSGAVEASEAYRRSADRAGFLSLLKRQGIDTADIERLA